MNFCIQFRQVADSPSFVAETEVRRSPSAYIYSNDSHAGCTGAVPQLPWAYLLTVGWQHTSGAETGKDRDLVVALKNIPPRPFVNLVVLCFAIFLTLNV